MADGLDPQDLLQRHIPLLRYDSQEPYFADAASEWTDNPGNQLRRADGTVIAAATPPGDQPRLSLSFLESDAYPNGDAVAHGDRIADRRTTTSRRRRRCTPSRSTPTASTVIGRPEVTAASGSRTGSSTSTTTTT